MATTWLEDPRISGGSNGPVWVERFDHKSGRGYYWNRITNQTSWEIPKEPTAPPPSPPKPSASFQSSGERPPKKKGKKSKKSKKNKGNELQGSALKNTLKAKEKKAMRKKSFMSENIMELHLPGGNTHTSWGTDVSDYELNSGSLGRDRSSGRPSSSSSKRSRGYFFGRSSRKENHKEPDNHNQQLQKDANINKQRKMKELAEDNSKSHTQQRRNSFNPHQKVDLQLDANNVSHSHTSNRRKSFNPNEVPDSFMAALNSHLAGGTIPANEDIMVNPKLPEPKKLSKDRFKCAIM